MTKPEQTSERTKDNHSRVHFLWHLAVDWSAGSAIVSASLPASYLKLA